MTGAHGGPPAEEPSARRSSRVRPYTITGGRTRPRSALALETLVQAIAHDGGRHAGGPEHSICRVCVRPVSVAEIAARCDLPLGVTRVLLDDMARAGLVRIHASSPDRPDRVLMERVLDGLRRL